MEQIEKMGRHYSAMLQTICGDDYHKIRDAAEKMAAEHRCADFYNPKPQIAIGKIVLKRR